MEPKKEILYDGWYYDVTSFMSRHPGGIEILEHHTKPGEDATAAIQQFHNRSFGKVLGILKSFERRPATDVKVLEDESDDDDPVSKRNKVLNEDFLKLFLEFKKEGLFEPSYSHIASRVLEGFIWTGLGALVLSSRTGGGGGPGGLLLGCVLLTLGQKAWIWMAHEAGHYSLTGKPKLDRVLEGLFAGVTQGFSASWWRYHHNLHHGMTNRLEHDLDLDTLPILAYNAGIVKDPKRQLNFMIRYQQYFLLFDAILANLYWKVWESGRMLIKKPVLSDALFVFAHYYLAYNFVSFPVYFLTTWMTTVYFFGQFGLSHSFLPARPEDDKGACHWVEAALKYTTDVSQAPWCDWWMGYLNYQVEHHLFPSMPQFRHPLIVDRVKAFAERHGLPYYVHSYWDAALLSWKNFVDVGAELKKLESEIKNE